MLKPAGSPDAPRPQGTFGVRSIGVWLQRGRLSAFLGAKARFRFLPPGVPAPHGLDGLAGWGAKGTARAEAARLGVPYLALEDGFLRTAGLGGKTDRSLSLTADLIGVHYDCASESGLERIIQTGGFSPEELEDAARLMAVIRDANLGKFNGAPDASPNDPVFAKGPPVFVVDQIARDKSIEAGGCGPETFAAMLDAAIAENPGMTVAARVHPFDGVGGRKGHLKALAQARSVHIYDANVSWMSAAKLAARVYVATSHAGLEALIAGAKVTCFGMPAYAGWGLTDDRIACPRRTARPSLDALIAAIYGRYSHYLSPLDGEPCTALDIARLLAARRRRDAETEGVTHVLGVNRLKRVQIRPFVEGKRSRVTWTMKPDDALAWQRADGGRIVSWASREPVDFHAACKAQGAPHIRLEDGFLRSVGLGANLELPASLVLDDQGIYYDPRTPSGLETLLQTAVFDAETLYRASALRDAIRAARVSKYNVGGGEVAELFANAGKRSKVLVPAQVEADASVLLGGGDIQTNLALLQAVRTARPDAFIVFKPHPDVEAGIRPGAVPRGVALTLADVIAEKAAMPDLLDQVDEVHTLTSLSGFEALLRDVPVIAYGSPFYAGWGLTEDRQNFPHRSRRLSLDELVAGTLLLYPRYTHRPSDWPCEAEDVVRQLQFSLRKKGAEGLIGRRRALTMLRQLMGRPPK